MSLTPDSQAETEARAAARAALVGKAEDVLVLDLRGLTGFTDFFVIATGASERRRATIVEAVRREIRETFGRKPIHVEAAPGSAWLLADYVDFVVHVFSPAGRALYELERLWGDAPRWTPDPSGPPDDPAETGSNPPARAPGDAAPDDPAETGSDPPVKAPGDAAPGDPSEPTSDEPPEAPDEVMSDIAPEAQERASGEAPGEVSGPARSEGEAPGGRSDRPA